VTSGPQPFRRSLETLLDDLGSAPVESTASLLDRWPEVVGRERAEHTRPVGVRHGVLVVQADDPAYAESLAWEERLVLQRLASLVGEGVVTGLTVRVSR
jgi:predicted nucleic acid-binding Zn ribbon protein